MTKSEIKKTFHGLGIQVSDSTVDLIQRELCDTVKRMALRCVKGNVKRLSPNLFFVALGRLSV